MNRPCAIALTLTVVGSCIGCGDSKLPRPAPSASATNHPGDAPIFADVTPGSGVDFTYRNGEEANYYAMIETLGGGVALIDYNRDGLLDIFVTGGGHFGRNKEIIANPCKLYRNDGNWKFTDVTAEVGLDKIAFYSHGAAVGDFNNDGWPDLLVTGYGRLALFRNNHGKFEDVTAASGLMDKRDIHWSTSAAWGDFNGDGFLDLYVCHYARWSFRDHVTSHGYVRGQEEDIGSPSSYAPLPHALYINNGDGTFHDASQEAGLRLGPKSGGRGLGVIAADFDDDGKLDLYVANDMTDNFLYLNQGGGRFQEVGTACGVAANEHGKPDGSMGVAAADFDGSGRLSVFVTNFALEVHALYRNRGGGQFQHSSTVSGITALGMNFVGWGTAFVDFDLDGAEDLIISNGHSYRVPPPPFTRAQRAVLLRNTRRPGDPAGATRFQDLPNQAGDYFQHLHHGRGLAVGDLDNDGKPDIVLNHCNEPVVLLRNSAGTNHHWLGIELIGKPNADAIGAKLTLQVGSERLVRHVLGGGSYLSSGDRRVLFGLGASERVGSLTVRWPSGRVQTWEHLGIDRYWQLTEGVNEAQLPMSRNPKAAAQG
jgi:enediyne biosynthesis protein E4